ncbi:hypothetical protein L5515_007142 [Caenorhabditis briggsae]|uniref:Uncharacterized protein n=1 Tax=Caenorhabditis briggsae TaxID=6238 RepID=A0AAE9JKE0_CAEBR|nr:hypothetical protein L5515_007142 [Caenorhabditis briggsae]
MVRVYEHRWYLLTRNRKLWRKFRGPLCYTNYIICITFFIPFLFFVPDQTEAIPAILKKVPCYHLYTQNVPLYVFTLNPIPPIITVAVFSIVQIGLMTLFISLTVRVLTYQARRNTTSQYTISLHRRFLYALIAQTGLPVIVVFCPLLSLFYLIPMGYHNQMITNFIFIFVSLHGVVTLLDYCYRMAPLIGVAAADILFRKLLNSGKSEFQFRQIIINRENVNKQLLRICQDYILSFESR